MSNEKSNSKKSHEELVAVFQKELWRSDSGDWSVIALSGNVKATGNSKQGEFIPGIQYRFLGKWSQTKYGPTFEFKGFVQHEPASRDAIVKYLSKLCKGIGPSIAHALVDEFGREKAISNLRVDPELCSQKIKLLNPKIAEEASKSLQQHKHREETKLALLGLLDGYGFPASSIDTCIDRFGVKAAERIRNNPWCMLDAKIPGAGFLRVDRLYIDLGFPADSIDRQKFAMWHYLRSSMDGHTWFTKKELLEYLNSKITGGVRYEECVTSAKESGMIVVHGELIAEKSNAEDEDLIAHVLSLPVSKVDYNSTKPSGSFQEGAGEVSKGEEVRSRRGRKIIYDD